MSTARATWFCIDIEANGPVPGLYDMVSLGATVVYREASGALALGEDFDASGFQCGDMDEHIAL